VTVLKISTVVLSVRNHVATLALPSWLRGVKTSAVEKYVTMIPWMQLHDEGAVSVARAAKQRHLAAGLPDPYEEDKLASNLLSLGRACGARNGRAQARRLTHPEINV
jgi:hypothetical protein